jgi:hypothetical protein
MARRVIVRVQFQKQIFSCKNLCQDKNFLFSLNFYYIMKVNLTTFMAQKCVHSDVVLSLAQIAYDN